MHNLNFSELLSTARDISYEAPQLRILEAALAEAAAQGLHGLTIEGVARRCRRNRATIYRHFGNRDKLAYALVVWEANKMMQVLTKAVAGIDDPEALLVEGFVAAMRFAREHPVISRTTQYEPGSLIFAARANDHSLLRLGAGFMANTIRWAQSKGLGTHLDADAAGDIAARLFSSFVLLPGGHNALNDDESTRQFALSTLAPMLLRT
ncbi:TetR/AcrR family transcriptional regulator [Marinobacter mobilis]|uniref:Transcriptional regulator, TetR family n=1 Tax=Marinobacter mobilis TaxID=488533 RepID=A0A1H2SBW2_9GAMM|nr:TetR/AcrR family transcriptional regulator [Marinobacter mobilis]SDW29126.1 transcriptional regulator, TetR family [Marinobacter mobilis]